MLISGASISIAHCIHHIPPSHRRPVPKGLRQKRLNPPAPFPRSQIRPSCRRPFPLPQDWASTLTLRPAKDAGQRSPSAQTRNSHDLLRLVSSVPGSIETYASLVEQTSGFAQTPHLRPRPAIISALVAPTIFWSADAEGVLWSHEKRLDPDGRLVQQRHRTSKAAGNTRPERTRGLAGWRQLWQEKLFGEVCFLDKGLFMGATRKSRVAPATQRTKQCSYRSHFIDSMTGTSAPWLSSP